MDEKNLQEMKLEEILREFREDPAEDPAESREIAEEPALAEQTAEDARMTDPGAEESQNAEEVSDTQIDDTAVFAPVEREDTEPFAPVEATSADPAMEDDTVRLDIPKSKSKKVSGDTIRLDGITREIQKNKKKNREDVEITQVLDIPEKYRAPEQQEPYSEHWEPEYEQPMGEYVPPQPIVFQPRSRLRELKKDLIAGPEKRYYEISEKGFGKLQTAIFLSFLVSVVAITATVIYAMGMVTPERMKLMVFGQFFTMLLSGALGSYLMMDGIGEIFHGKFTLNAMLCFTFIACMVDGVFSLQQLKVPCCAAFCIQVTMALISAHESRRIELGQMDTMRKANRLDGVAVCPDYLENQPGILRKEAQVSEFMDHYQERSKQEKVMSIYALVALLASIGVAVLAGMTHNDLYVGFRVLAVTLLAAMPATAFLALTRPFAILENRLHSLGTVLCGWKNAEKLAGKALFPLDHEDIYPAGTARLNGVKFFGTRQPDQIMSYCTAVIAADDGGMAPIFTQVLESRNGYHYDAVNLEVYDGGIGAEVEGEPVLVGSQMFLKKMGVEVPEGIRVSSAVCISIDGEFSGLFAVTYEKVRSTVIGMNTLTSYRNLLPVIVSSDFMLSPAFLQSRFGIKPKKVLMPDQSVRQQLREKKLPEEAPALAVTTRPGLASAAFGVTGARALHTAATLGVAVHMIGGILGLAMMIALVLLGALDLLTPVNMFLYQLVWIIPGFLITEWTRSV